MDNGADRYLHKKFKKQLSIEPNRTKQPLINNNHTQPPTNNINTIINNNNNNRVPTITTTTATNNNNSTNSVVVQNYKSSISRGDNDILVCSEQRKSSTDISYGSSSRLRSDEAGVLNLYNSSGNLNETVFGYKGEDLNRNENHVYSKVAGEYNRNQSESFNVKRDASENRYKQSEPGYNNETRHAYGEDGVYNLSEAKKPNDNSHAYEYSLSQSENEEVKTHSADGTSSNLYGGEEEKQEGKSGNGGGKYVCTYCNLACSKPSVLQKHIRAHTNERPYPCVSCGFSFKTRSNLYKHCRSRTHANKVMGHKAREMVEGDAVEPSVSPPEVIKEEPAQPVQNKPYKPRFHTAKFFDENTENNQSNSEKISTRINELIDKNNSIVSKSDHYLLKRRPSIVEEVDEVKDEPLNLTSKSRKRCLSEVSEPAVQKSLIKELLLKNYADTNMQCPHCKMIFQTVTELELHKMRNCKGMTKTGARYSRSSSVNVASILTQNKNAFDNIHQVFPLKSPGPFLGKTRLVESDKTKSFSYEDVIQFPSGDLIKTTQRYSLSPVTKKAPVKLFGGELKIALSSGDAKGFKAEHEQEQNYNKTENHVVKATLQTGGTILQNKKPEVARSSPENLRVYDNHESKDCLGNGVTTYENNYKYTNLMDFSQKAARMLAPNLHHQLNVTIPGLPIPAKYAEATSPLLTLSTPPPSQKTKILTSPVKMQDSPSARMQELTISQPAHNGNITNPMNILYNGKVVRYVPGIPGPVQPFEPAAKPRIVKPDIMITPVAKTEEAKPPSPILAKPPEITTPKKFARPDSLALKPSMSNLKQHHGLTPTMFNQILISPDTPRGAKKYNEHFLHGNYFSYLGLKSSTKPVYCTLNKTQPFYVPHFKKLSMYSEWRQQDQKTDRYYASAYDSRQRPPRRFAIAGKYDADNIVHSSYKFTISEVPTAVKEETPKATSILGGYESNEDYTYIRGRDESSTRQQEHEAAYGLLSLSQKPASTVSTITDPNISPMSVNSADCTTPTTPSFINAEQLAQVSKTSYAKNKILDQQKPTTFSPSLLCSTITSTTTATTRESLGLTNAQTPLMYPYTNINLSAEIQRPTSSERMEVDSPKSDVEKPSPQQERKNIIHFNVIKRYSPHTPTQNYYNRSNNEIIDDEMQNLHRKRKHVNMEASNYKLQKSDSSSEVMDLSMPQEKQLPVAVNGDVEGGKKGVLIKSFYNEEPLTPQNVPVYRNTGGEVVHVDKDNNRINVNYIVQESSGVSSDVPKNWIKTIEYDNSAMETLADIATKQEKLEKNSVAKNVATEFLKLATKNEYPNGDDKAFMNSNKEINDLVVKSEENKSCTICSKNFSKPSQLRLHMNIHYLERPYKCESCAVSFRTKGHLQKHERSAGHHNKLSSSPALSSSEPRPFKCSDCSIAFRIHGHLAKHLRSKMHIMKLECLAKIPFGLYAELERSNSLLTEINTADGDQCLDSLKMLAKKVFVNDPSKLNQLDDKSVDHPETDTDS